MSRPVYISYSLATADADGISLSQTPLAAGNLLINGALASGGVATLDKTRQVLFTFAADETGHTFVVYGTNAVVNGNPISETVAGTTAGTVATTQSFGTVTRISISAAATGAITVGTNGVGATPAQLVNFEAQPVGLTIAVVVTGTVNYTVQHTYDDIMGLPNPSSWSPTTPSPTWIDDSVLASKTTTGETTYNDPIMAWRVVLNSGSGSLAIKAIQSGIVG